MPHLAVRNLRVHLGSLEVVKDVSFAVEKGDVLALVGPSGSGKSTILRSLIGLHGTSGGVVEVGGQIIDMKRPGEVRALRDKMAIVFQQYNLFQNMTVLENVTFAPLKVQRRARDEVMETARQLLDKVGLLHKAGSFPDQLSGGQQQRVAIARALALKPEILLLDEVTSALDPELVCEVLDTIRQMAHSGMTMMLVSHEMNFVREVADRVIFLDGGMIVEDGAPKDIFQNPRTDRARDFFGKVMAH